MILNIIVANIRATFRKIWLLLHQSSFDSATEEGRSKERYRRIFITTATSVITKSLSILTTLITVPLTVNYLGTERYGLWMTISSTIAMLGFADLGMGNGLLNAVSEANGKDDRQSVRIYVSSAFFMLLAIATIILVTFASIYASITWKRVFNVTSDLAAHESGPAIAILVASFALNMPLGIAQRVHMGYQEDFKNQAWEIVGAFVGLGGVLLAIYLKAGLPWLVLAISGGPVLARLMNWIVLFGKSRTWLFPRWTAFRWSASRKIIGTGTWFFLLQMLSLLSTNSDNVIIAQSLGASEVASYAVTQKLFSTAFVSQFFITPLWPAFGEAIARADYAWIRRTLNRSLRLSFGIGLGTALILLVFAKPLISIWAGSDLVPSTLLIIGFAVWLLLIGYIGTMSTFFNSSYLLNQQLSFLTVACTISLLLKVVLVHRLQAAGVIWATVFGYGLFYVIPAAKVANKIIIQWKNEVKTMSMHISEKCPVCHSETIIILSLKREFIINKLESYFREKPPEQLEIVDYEINRCKNCTLEYALPLQAGNQSFYQWVTTRPGYYPKSRWEWFAAIEQIKKRQIHNKSFSILEIGCGEGDFIKIAHQIPNVRVVGLDTTPESVAQCRKKGLEVFCETIESFQQNVSNEGFDYIVSFHCLEHVTNPKTLVESMLFMLKPEGSLFISTPYSPMSFEKGWFDIMNYPPHHLTRWNKRAYDELARQEKCSIQYFMPTAMSAISRTTNSIHLSILEKSKSRSKLRLILTILMNPLLFLKNLFEQLKRFKLNGKIAADIVLVEFKKLENS